MTTYNMWYNKITNCKAKFTLGMTDTDSFLFEVDKPKVFWDHIDESMDYSNYPIDHPKFSNDKKAIPGYLKDEFCATQKCKHFIGLRAKVYSMKLKEKNNKLTSQKSVLKGIGRACIRSRVSFDDYLFALRKKQIIRHEYNTIRSTKHKISTVRIHKRALSHFDSKKFLLRCGRHSYSYGSKNIRKVKNCPYCPLTIY